MENSTKEVETFQCDHCYYQVNCKVIMSKYMDKEHTVIPQLDGLENISRKIMKEDPAAFKMGRDGYLKLKHIDPEVIPPNRVFHPDLGVGDNVFRLSFGIQLGGNTPSTTGSGVDFQRRIYNVKKNSL